MYTPRAFREDDIGALRAAMRRIGAAAIVGRGPDGLVATHAPVEIVAEPEPLGTIRCHFARANPHAGSIASGGELLLVFQGPQGYVTPNWYPSKRASGEVVPTWNYVAIHAYGTARTFDDPALLKAHLAALTDGFESGRPEPWGIDDAPADFVDGMVRAIVGIEIAVTRVEGKWKMSQNRPADDAAGVAAGFRAQGDDALAALVERANGL